MHEGFKLKENSWVLLDAGAKGGANILISVRERERSKKV